MARTWSQPNFRQFAALQSEPARGSLDPHRKDEPDTVSNAAEKRETFTISQYRDPRDWLDHERHAMRAEARQELEKIGDDQPDSKRK